MNHLLSKRKDRDKDPRQYTRLILGIVVFFFWASEYAHVPYFTPYLKELGFSAVIIGIMTGTYGFTQMCIRIPLGIATDITGGYKKVVIMGTVFTTVSSFGLIFAKSVWFIIFCRFLAGLAASTWIAFSVLYSACYDSSEGVSAMTNINIFNNAGKVAAFLLGTLTASLWGYRYPLIVSFLAGIGAIVFALQIKEIPIQRKPIQVKDLIQTFKNPCLLIASGFAIVIQMVFQGTTFSFTSTVAEMIGASRLEIGINTSLFTIVQVAAGGWIARHFVKKVQEKWSVFAGFACVMTSCVLSACAPDVRFLFLAQIAGGIGNIILMSLLMAMAIRSVPMERKSTAMGLFQALYGIGMTLGPVLNGKMVDSWSYQVSYMIFGAICAAAMLLSLILVPWMNRREKQPV